MARTTRYRFRSPSDRKLLESIMLHKPYAAPYGSKAAKWALICADLTAFELSNAQYRETKADQLTARACRNRFKILQVDYPLRYGKYCTAEQRKVLALLDMLQYEVGHSSPLGSTVKPPLVVPVKKKTAMEFILNSTPSDDCMGYKHPNTNRMDEEDGDTTSNDSHDCPPTRVRSSSSCSSVYSNYESYIQEEDDDDELEANHKTVSLQDVLHEFKALLQTVTTLIETKNQLHRHEDHAADFAPPVQLPSYPSLPMKSRMMSPESHHRVPSNLHQQHLSTARTTTSSGHRVIQ